MDLVYYGNQREWSTTSSSRLARVVKDQACLKGAKEVSVMRKAI